jgi:hypothetical protein
MILPSRVNGSSQQSAQLKRFLVVSGFPFPHTRVLFLTITEALWSLS